MGFFVNVVNQILFFAYSAVDRIFQAFGLSWIGFTVGLATISVILRLFAGNLVGTSVNIHRSRQNASAEQRIERQKTKASTGQGASYSTRRRK